jgi:hypothetical protein
MENQLQDKKAKKSKIIKELFGDVLGRVPPNSKELEEAVSSYKPPFKFKLSPRLNGPFP